MADLQRDVAGQSRAALTVDQPELARLLSNPRRVGERSLLVSEIFGPTVQGEGLNVGKAAMFVRLGGCPLSCSWCDTQYAWRATDPSGEPNSFEIVPVSEVAARLLTSPARRAVLTGGEPLMQRDAAAQLGEALLAGDVAMEVETSGVIDPGPLAKVVDLFTVSPKLANSGMPACLRLRWPVLGTLAALPSVFKFVVTEPSDLTEIDLIVERLGLPGARVLVMPEGTTPSVVLKRANALVADVVGRGWGLSPRWHVLLWGDERGR